MYCEWVYDNTRIFFDTIGSSKAAEEKVIKELALANGWDMKKLKRGKEV